MIILLITFFLLFTSCTPTEPTVVIITETTGNESPVSDVTTTTSTTVPVGKVNVTLTNMSRFSVNVFVNANRNIGGEVFAAVDAGQSLTAVISPSQTDSGDAFYFEYNIPIGNVTFPYYSYENAQVALIAPDKPNEIIIDDLTASDTSLSYLLLENRSGKSIQLQNSSVVLTPDECGSSWIDSLGSGVYRIGSSGEPINIRDTTKLSVMVGSNVIAMPDVSYQPGMIYTITVGDNADTPIFKAVTPFNIDLQRQIWQVTCRNRKKISDCIVKSHSVSGGTVILGSSDTDKLFAVVLDQYGAVHSECEMPLSGLAESGSVIDYCYVCDGLENSDGTIVLIAKIVYDDEDAADDTWLLCWSPGSKAFRWVYNFADCAGLDDVIVRMDCQNTIIRRDNGIYAVGCAVVDSGSGIMSPFFAEFDCNNANAIAVRSYKTPNISDTANEESMFTSVYYDLQQSAYIAVGYEHWDSSYPSEHTYNGVVYRIYPDVSGDLTAEVEAAYNNCLFFGIDGDDNGHYCICGETMLPGRILQGCYLSSSMVSQNAVPRACHSDKTHCWYNQISLFDDKIVCCGQTSDDFNGTGGSVPIVTAFDFEDNILWENTAFDGWSTAYSCFPNGICSYIVELYNADSGATAIVSADLLGKNTGENVRIFE